MTVPPLTLTDVGWRMHKRAIQRAGKRACVAALLPVVSELVPILRDTPGAASNQSGRFLAPEAASELATSLLDALATWIATDDVRPVAAAAPSNWTPLLSGHLARFRDVAVALESLVAAAVSGSGFEQHIHVALSMLHAAGVPLERLDQTLRAAYVKP